MASKVHEQKSAKETNGTKVHDPFYGLSSPWTKYYSPPGIAPQGRWEGELDNLVVYGEIPKEIEGTFCRLIVDPHFPPHPENGFVEGDGNICAFRFQDGRVDLKMKYVETERWLLERKANERLFHIYRNPFSNHPCVRMANDSTANTNILYWGGQLLAISERGLPYAVDPDTLETKGCDPYAGQVKAKTFTAHPKVDPFANEMVTWGYEAKGLGTPDVCVYTIDPEGKVSNEFWFQEDEPTMVHDAWVTENWIVLCSMPFKVNSDEDLKKGSQHWEYVPDRPSGFHVAPRRPGAPHHPGWKPGEVRRYTWDNGLVIHTGGAWEDEDGNLKLESHFVASNVIFTFWNPPGMKTPEEPTGDYVRWTMDLSRPAKTRLPDPEVLFRGLVDFPKTDERFLTRRQRIVYLAACDAGKAKVRQFGFNSVVRLDTETRETAIFDPGEEGSRLAEPVFVLRSDDAPEGDGWVIFWCDSPSVPKGQLFILDTDDFTKPVALVQLPFAMRNQVHGNWIPNTNPGKPLPWLTKTVKHVVASTHGSLDRI
ncbi:hypothetical protein Daus18300_004133 [Diaporthe australafricana]|uniref:Isoeugenol monooxygenase n=1 Tax=Diaporthe australafricana TaxID=127596 RepID=A0ABR3XBC7_9PEZI